ncbi:MAG: peptidoglycan DD-metalloendopeptidase family protein [Stagnimonas sp.]|nr:peptidoglycan DD-metalloendopeptidase family protein [Stagnimonas sp.]
MRARFPFRRFRLLLAILLLPMSLAAAAPVSKPRQKELDRIQLRIQALNRTLEQDRQKRDALDADMEDAEKKLAASRAELERMAGELSARQAELSKAEAARNHARDNHEAERTALGQELRAIYITGQREQAKLLLSQDSAGPVGRLLTYQDYLSRARAERVTRMRDEGLRLSTAQARLQQETAQLKLLKEENEKIVAEDTRLKVQRATLLAKLNERIDDEEDRLKSLLQDEKDLTRVIDNIKTVLADEPVKTPAVPERDGTPARAFGQGRGRLAWPLRGELLANYGDPKVGGKLAWKGLWIAASRGTPVKAAARGRVAYVGFMHRYGLIVIVEHEDSHFTLYGHLDNVATTAGETVGVGETIGQVGDSGGHDQTGLYFELRKGTEPLDPRGWLQP